ncbi:Winged helix DNA-binding domain-containing protein OS=Streptomyces glaucescens OX=1907 GN=SGLAU_26610 PE=4 SV=1 [Streptomyces glaucescens]
MLTTRALNRATLARQLLLRRSPMSAEAAVEHLVGLQAQEVKPPYVALAARLDGFAPEELSGLLAGREVVRMVTLRSTIHLHTADDALTLRPLVQPARDREVNMKQFREGLVGRGPSTGSPPSSRALVEEEPRTMRQLREALLAEWPDADPLALAVAARCKLPLVQVTPRGLWGRSWPGRPHHRRALAGPPGRAARVRRLGGPALPRRLRSGVRAGHADLGRADPDASRLRTAVAPLVTFRDPNGVELFDLPDAPRPDPDTPAPPRLLPEFDNLLLSHADRTRVIPAAQRGRTWQVNTFSRPFLVDGFLAGVWWLYDDALVIEPFTEAAEAARDEVAAEAERMLRVLYPGGSYDIRFGTVTG